MARRRSRRQKSRWGIVIMAVLVSMAILLCSRAFVVRKVVVVGNRNLSQDEVIALSGVQIKDNLLSLNDAQLKKALERNYYIVYVGHDFDYHGTLTLRISERQSMAVFGNGGYYYSLDEKGMVLKELGNVEPDRIYGPRVKGFELSPHAIVSVGTTLPVSKEGQIEAMTEILEVLDFEGMLRRTKEISVKNIANLNVTMEDGTCIELGGLENLGFKLDLGHKILERREEYHDPKGSKIDVSSGIKGNFIPSNRPTPTPVSTPVPTPTPEETPMP